MELTDLQKELIQEMIKQKAPEKTIQGIMERLTTEKQQKVFLEYLIKTKNIAIPTGKIILKSIEIAKMEK